MADENSNLDLEIRVNLGRYLSGGMTLGQFREWFGPMAWDVHLKGNPLAPVLAYTLNRLLAELECGDLSQEEFNEAIEPMVETHYAGYDQAPREPTVSLSSLPFRVPRPFVVGR